MSETPQVLKRPDYPECSIDAELHDLIGARYTMLYVVTWEENRVIRALEKICEMKDINLSGVHIWDSAKGFVARTGEDKPYVPIPDGEDCKNPELAIEFIMKKAEENRERVLKATSNRGPLYVLCDMHRYMKEDITPELERKIRVLAALLKRSTISVIMTGPELQLPLSLEKVITVLDYPLPGAEQIKVLVEHAGKKLIARKRITQQNFDAIPREKVVKAVQGLTLTEAEDALAKAVVVSSGTDPMAGKFDIGVLLSLKKQIIRKGQILDIVTSEEHLNSIGGLEGVKQWIGKKKKTFSDAAREYGLPFPKGVFLLGLQGTGKSLCAKVIANELQIPLLKLDLGKVFQSHIGESEGNCRRVLKLAEAVAPCVLFIDELDMALSGSQTNETLDGGVSKRVISTLMDWMQEKTAPVFLVACANSLNIPPAVLRKGRFDERFFVDLPTDDEKEAIFKIHIAKRHRDPSKFDLNKLCQAAKNFSGAEIEAVVVDGMEEAFCDGGREPTTEDMLEQIEISHPLAETMKEELDLLRDRAYKRMRSASKVMAKGTPEEDDAFNL